jgi:predicted Zn-dependent protease
MQGLVYRVKPREVAEADRLDLERTLYLLDHVYRYTGLGNGTTPLNESSVRMLSNFAASFLQIGLVFRKPLRERHAEIKKLEVAAAKHPDTAAALALMKKRYDDTLALVLGKLNQCISLLPWDWRPRALRHEFLIAGNRLPEAETAMREALKIEPANAQYLQMMAQVLTMEGKKNEASDVLRNVPESSLNSLETYASIAEAFAASGSFDSAIAVMQEFASLHPGDRRAMDAVAQLERLRK